MSENIKVICRIRPLNASEIENGSHCILKQISNTTVQVEVNEDPKRKYQEKNFTFDHIAPPETSQKKFYSLVGKPIVNDVLNGYNGTLFAYGQTSSGKTHTMEGDLQNPTNYGIIPRYIHDIFEHIYSMSDNLEFQIKVSYFEIYMDKIRDLMDVTKENLPVKQNKEGVPYVKGITEFFVSSPDEIFEIIETGKANRHVAVTNMNEHSSRSHSVFLLQVRQKNLSTGKQLLGKLYMVDLAGSEKVSKTGAGGTLLTEAKNINKSLSALGLVINSLVEGHSYIPYRDSKLTRILQESLGGNARTTMVICVSPASYNEHETRSTLMFGMRAKTIKNEVKVNEELTAEEWQCRYEKQKTLNDKLKRILTGMRSELNKWRNGETVNKSDWFNINDIGHNFESKKSDPSIDSVSIHSDDFADINNKNELTSTTSPNSKIPSGMQELYHVIDDKEEEIIQKDEQIRLLTEQLHEEKEINKTTRVDFDITSAENIRLQTENETNKEEVKEVLQALEELAANFDEKAGEVDRLFSEIENLRAELKESKLEGNNTLTELQRIKEKRDISGQKFHEWIMPLCAEVHGIGNIVNSNLPKPDITVDCLESDIANLRRYAARIKQDLVEMNSELKSNVNSLPISKEEQFSSDLKNALELISQFQQESCPNQENPDSQTVSGELIKKFREQKHLSVSSSREIELRTSNDAFKEENHLLKNQNENLMKNLCELKEKLDHFEKERQQRNIVKSDLNNLDQTVLKEINNLRRLKKMFVDDMAQKLSENEEMVGSLETVLSNDTTGVSIAVGEKVKFLEDNLNQLTNAHKNLTRERTELILDNGVLEKRLKVVSDRVKVLENNLRDAKQTSLSDRKRYERELERFRDTFNRQSIHRRSIAAGHIMRPIRPGSIYQQAVTAVPQSSTDSTNS